LVIPSIVANASAGTTALPGAGVKESGVDDLRATGIITASRSYQRMSSCASADGLADFLMSVTRSEFT
jgi:hypothetical protein